MFILFLITGHGAHADIFKIQSGKYRPYYSNGKVADKFDCPFYANASGGDEFTTVVTHYHFDELISFVAQTTFYAGPFIRTIDRVNQGWVGDRSLDERSTYTNQGKLYYERRTRSFIHAHHLLKIEGVSVSAFKTTAVMKKFSLSSSAGVPEHVAAALDKVFDSFPLNKKQVCIFKKI